MTNPSHKIVVASMEAAISALSYGEGIIKDMDALQKSGIIYNWRQWLDKIQMRDVGAKEHTEFREFFGFVGREATLICLRHAGCAIDNRYQLLDYEVRTNICTDAIPELRLIVRKKVTGRDEEDFTYISEMWEEILQTNGGNLNNITLVSAVGEEL